MRVEIKLSELKVGQEAILPHMNWGILRVPGGYTFKWTGADTVMVFVPKSVEDEKLTVLLDTD